MTNMDIQRIICLIKETREIIGNREMAARVREKGVADYVTQVDIAVQDFLKKEWLVKEKYLTSREECGNLCEVSRETP